MPRVLGIADSDSYLKWSASTLAALPDGYQATQVVVASPLTPSVSQMVAAASARVPVATARDLVRLIADEQPEMVLLAATGPVVAALTERLLRLGSGRRPVLITGLPGVNYPPSRRAVEFRQGCDLFLVHSRRERRSHHELPAATGGGLRIGLARLPYLAAVTPPEPDAAAVIFAAQALVPASAHQRRATLQALAAVTPAGSAVVKLRAGAGESETHHDRLPYQRLWDELVAEGSMPHNTVRFSHAPMTEVLRGARACVTISSTAALEAMAAGIDVLLLQDFGIGPTLINEVFLGSGCFGTLGDVSAGHFHRPSAAWMADNYFHPADDSDWLDQLGLLIDLRASFGLAPRPNPAVGGGAAKLRRTLRLSPLGRRR